MTKRTDILDLMVTELKRINKTTDTRTLPRSPYTYKSNVFGNVEKKFLFMDEINDFPYITFIVSNEARHHIGAGVKYGIISLFVRGYIHDENALDAADDLLEDIDYILNTISYLPEACSLDLEDVKILTATTDEGLFEPYGICELTVEARYLI